MFKKAFSFTFLFTSILLMVIAYPLFAGLVDPNMIYGYGGDVPLESDEWITLNRAYGGGTFAYGAMVFFYHVFALMRMRDVSNGTYAMRGLLALLVSLIPAYIIMMIIQ